MEAQEIIELFDSCWFGRRKFKPKYEAPSTTALLMLQRLDGSGEERISGPKKNQTRSLSERCLGVDLEAAACRGSIITKPILQKISSGKEVVVDQENTEKSQDKKQPSRRKKGRKWMTRSLSALEFEEIKGFMDLGFVFDEEDKNPGLVSIIPGLQNWRPEMTDCDEETIAGRFDGKEGEVSRPYLSEAWSVSKMSRKDNGLLVNWQIPSAQNEIIMKNHLRFWAHAVASNVR